MTTLYVQQKMKPIIFSLIHLLIIGALTLVYGAVKREHTLLFGEVSHLLPIHLFDKPRVIARLVNPGITEEFRFEENKEVSAVIVVTKIKKEYPKDDQLLDKIAPKQKNMQDYFGDDTVLLRAFELANRRVQEMVFLNAEYNPVSFPYGMGGRNLKRDIESLGISQSIVRDGLYIECAIYLEKKADENKNDFIDRARRICEEWTLSIEAKKSAEPVGVINSVTLRFTT